MRKETGIIMSGDHPRLVLEGLKTQTRRTAGLQKINEAPHAWRLISFKDGVATFNNHHAMTSLEVKCPYGGVGDRLWVREATWYFEGSRRPHYVASEEPNRLSRHFGKVKPSIHLFKKDARIWCEITAPPIPERVQDISGADCIAEGIKKMHDIMAAGEDEIMAFACLWDSLNLKRGHGWSRNDWVWPIGFKYIKI